MAKDDDRTNEPEEAGKWGTAGKSSGKNNKNGKERNPKPIDGSTRYYSSRWIA